MQADVLTNNACHITNVRCRIDRLQQFWQPLVAPVERNRVSLPCHSLWTGLRTASIMPTLVAECCGPHRSRGPVARAAAGLAVLQRRLPF